MSTTNAEDVVDGAHASDPIRIVPLHVPEGLLAPLAAAPAPAPHLTYRGGPLLTDVKVFTVYWGAAWQTDPQLVQMATSLDQFFGYVLTSPLLDQMAEYSQGGQAIGHGSWIGRAMVTAPAPQHVVSDAQIQQLITRELARPTGPPRAGCQHVVLRLPATRGRGRAGRRPLVSSVLRLPQQLHPGWYRHLLCGHALSGLSGLHRQPGPLRCPHLDQLA